MILIMVCTLENNYFLVRTKLGYLRYLFFAIYVDIVLISTETKNITYFLLLKAYSYHQQQCRFSESSKFCQQYNFRLYFAILDFSSFFTKVSLRFHRRCFFSLEKLLFPWKFRTETIQRRTKILISPVRNGILKI